MENKAVYVSGLQYSDQTEEWTNKTISLAGKVVKTFLEVSQISPKDVDFVIYASQSFNSDGPLARGHNVIMENYFNVEFSKIVMFSNGLEHVPYHGHFSTIAGDWIASIKLARTFILAEEFTNILVVHVDDVSPLTDLTSVVHSAVFLVSNIPYSNSLMFTESDAQTTDEFGQKNFMSLETRSSPSFQREPKKSIQGLSGDVLRFESLEQGKSPLSLISDIRNLVFDANRKFVLACYEQNDYYRSGLFSSPISPFQGNPIENTNS